MSSASRPSSPQPRSSPATTSSGAYGAGIAVSFSAAGGVVTSPRSQQHAAGFVPKDAYQRRSNASSMNPLTGRVDEHCQPGRVKDAEQPVFTSHGSVVEGFGSPRKSRGITEAVGSNPSDMRSPEQQPPRRSYNPAQESIKLFTAEGLTKPKGRKEIGENVGRRSGPHVYELNNSTVNVITGESKTGAVEEPKVSTRKIYGTQNTDSLSGSGVTPVTRALSPTGRKKFDEIMQQTEEQDLVRGRKSFREYNLGEQSDRVKKMPFEFSSPNNRSVVARPPTVVVHEAGQEPVSSPREKRPITGKPQDRPDRVYYDEPDIVFDAPTNRGAPKRTANSGTLPMGGKFVDPRATPDPAIQYRRKGGAGSKTDGSMDMALSPRKEPVIIRKDNISFHSEALPTGGEFVDTRGTVEGSKPVLHKRDAVIARVKEATAGRAMVIPRGGGASAAGPLPHYTNRSAPVIASESGPATLSSSGTTFSSAAVSAQAAAAAHTAAINGNGNGSSDVSSNHGGNGVVPPLQLNGLTGNGSHEAATPVSANGGNMGRMTPSASAPSISNRNQSAKGRKTLEPPRGQTPRAKKELAAGETRASLGYLKSYILNAPPGPPEKQKGLARVASPVGERKERRTGQAAGTGRDFSNPSDVFNVKQPDPAKHPLHPISKKTFKPREEKDVWKRKAPTAQAAKAQSSDPFMQGAPRPEDNVTTQRGRPRQRESQDPIKMVDRSSSDAALARERSPSRRNIPQQSSDIHNLHAPSQPQSARRVRGAAPAAPDASAGGARTERSQGTVKGRQGLAPPSQVWFMNPQFRRAQSPAGGRLIQGGAAVALARAASPPPRLAQQRNMAEMPAAGKPNPAMARASSPPPRMTSPRQQPAASSSTAAAARFTVSRIPAQ